ncbi:MAG: aminomethyl transferase family protein [Alphaproteobacteria bacterium]|nr:aminomethyl transferase family protein [Alphaproteobacteria bacterium]
MSGQPQSVDQSDRIVPVNLRQSGRTPVEMLISTRVRKSPFWHLSHEAGCWRATVYNRIYHPRGYVRPEEGGAAVEHEALTNHVTVWNVAVERQIQVRGPDAERFVDYVITRDATRIRPMQGKYVILCNEKGGILNDPVLLRLAEDEFWFSLADSDLLFWLQGVNVGKRMDVEINEIDVCPLQIQGPKSLALMVDLVGDDVRDIPYYGILETEVEDCPVVVTQSGFSGEKGYEIYLRDATLHAEKLWRAVLDAGEPHRLMVTAPGHQRRIQAGILSWGQDIDHETVPFQCNLAYQVPRRKKGDYIGRTALERMRAEIAAGRPPFSMVMVGMKLGGKPIDDYAPDFWLVSDADGGDPIGYLTSPWHAPELGSNIALGYVPIGKSAVGTELLVWLPDEYAGEPGRPDRAQVCEVPFRPSVNPSARELAHARGEDAAD